jgi:hypothetical protein
LSVFEISFRSSSGKELCPIERDSSVRIVIDRAIAQAVSRRLPIAAVRVLAQVSSYGICGVDKVVLGQVFL